MEAWCTSGLAMAKAVNQWLHSAEAWVHSQASVDKEAIGQIFSPSTLGFPCQYHSLNDTDTVLSNNTPCPSKIQATILPADMTYHPRRLELSPTFL
jgi:hypothetical protein